MPITMLKRKLMKKTGHMARETARKENKGKYGLCCVSV